MALIARTTEKDINYESRLYARAADHSTSIANAVSHAAVTTALDLGAKAVVTVTKSGATARMISKFRPGCMIIGCATSSIIMRQMNLSWGVYPVLIDEKSSTDELFEHALSRSVESGLLENGDIVVITAGIPLGVSGTTNMLRVEKAVVAAE